MRKYEGYSGRGAGRYWRHAGIVWGMRDGPLLFGVCGTDHLPEIGPAPLPFLAPPPPIHEGRGIGTVTINKKKKKNAYF